MFHPQRNGQVSKCAEGHTAQLAQTIEGLRKAASGDRAQPFIAAEQDGGTDSSEGCGSGGRTQRLVGWACDCHAH